MRLYFLRHGIAEERDTWEGEDFERPLTDRGRQRMEAEARAMAELELELDRILSSPFRRAIQTAEIVARELKLGAALAREGLLAPGFDSMRLAELLERFPRDKAILLVGHEPDFSKTVGEAIGGARMLIKKGGLVCVEIEGSPPPRGRLLWSLPPSALA